MRITTETIEKYVQEIVKQRVKKHISILAAYLQGTYVDDNPFLGGTADVDLVFVHIAAPEERRELYPLSDDVHLDIEHHGQLEYENPRELRVTPWTGPRIYHARILHDPRHIMDFAQATVRGLYHRSDFNHQRAQAFLGRAREGWMDLQHSQKEAGTEQVGKYLDALLCTGNAVASIHGKPLTRRRFLMDFPDRAERLGSPGLYQGMLGLLGASNAAEADLRTWETNRRDTFKEIPGEKLPLEINTARHNYYRKAIDVILDSERPKDIIFPLLYTWTLAIAAAEPGNPVLDNWQDVCAQLGLDAEGFRKRMRAFDAYLDAVEETIESWASRQGLSPT